MKTTTTKRKRGLAKPGLEIKVITAAQDIRRFDRLLGEEHYLGSAKPIGDFMRQVAVENGRWVGLLVWGPAAYRLKDRDQWIGWDAGRRAERLKLIAQNRRFLIPEATRRPNLASHVLGAAVKVLPRQWHEAFGYEPVLAETFTDIEAFEGTCYKAAGWEPLGICQGHSRHRADYYVPNGRPKKLWVKLLHPQARSVLCADRLAPGQEQSQVAPPTGQIPLHQEQMRSLAAVLRQVPDPRRNNTQFRIGPVLTLVAMALLSGAQQVTEIARFCHRLNQRQRAHLGLPRRGKFRRVPCYSVFYEVLTRLDVDAFSRLLSQWLHQHQGSLPRALALDGKSVRDRVMLVTLADPEGVAQAVAVCPGKGYEMTTAQKLLEQGPTLDEVVVTADALHCQKQTAQIIVQKGGDYLLQIKDNQPALHQLAQQQLQDASPLLPTTPKATAESNADN